MGYHKRLDPEVRAADESMIEQFMMSDDYEWALADYTAEAQYRFMDSPEFDVAFERWLETVEGEAEDRGEDDDG